jgi:hypothetical protein
MSSRISRYRAPAVVLPPDARDRAPASTPPRTMPLVTGSFRHVVSEGERLDQIAFHYYEEPTLWWRICDANPHALSPLALVGADGMRTIRIPLAAAYDGESPPWSTLVNTLTAIVGVEKVIVEESVTYGDQPASGESAAVTEQVNRALRVRFNGVVTSAETLRATLPPDLVDGEAVELGRLGRSIVIPPRGAT